MRHEHQQDGSGAPRMGCGSGRGPEGRGEAGGPRQRGRGGPGRMGRFFEHGDLRLVALQLISEKPRHGYEIIKAIEDQSGGIYIPSAGAVYPTLTLLQELGQLTVSEGADGRKLYSITAEGTAALVASRKTVEAVLARIAEAGASTGPMPQFRDAMHKLKHAFRLRLSRGPLDETQMQTLVQKIEALSESIAQD
ncbi:MAG: PadR family transcriptional regulator [Hyphomicrobiales bacterium]|nr:PadR family transcriptional regulator [Hyphomicrobiales bacterium]MDE2115432.1 PadR family transcriptional regulator [Hyphomicrobiales bacterium]